MNKKGVVILLSASLAFVIATIILLKGGETVNVLGDAQLNLSLLNKKEGLYYAYIDNAAKFALAETIKLTPSSSQDFYTLCKNNNPSCNGISQHFGTIFKKHLDSFNTAYNQKLDIKNYKFSSNLTTLDNKLAIEIIGTSTDPIIIQKGEDLTYTISPNFKIRADLEELNRLATTKETIAIAFFNDIVDKFQNCLQRINSGRNNCFCDNSEIDTKNLPEDYKVSIITTVEREQLFGGVEYKFKLLDKKGNVVASKRGEYIKTLKGVFGAYEYIDEDVKKNVCYPGAFAKDRTYTFDSLNMIKGRLYLFSREANCKGVSKFDMVGFVKESDYGKVTGSDCSLIGVKERIAEEKEWKVSAYFDGDSEVDQPSFWGFNLLERIGSSQLIDIYAQIDRWESEDGELVSEELNIDSKFGTRRYHVFNDANMRKITSKEIQEFGTSERNMGSYKTFKGFVEWTEGYSSKKSILAFKGHGYGIMTPIGRVFNLESEDNNADYDLPVYTVHKVFDELLKKKLDIVIFDSCEKATIEVAYQLKDHAKVMVASEDVMYNVFGGKNAEVKWSGVEYDKVLDYITKNPNIGARTLGKFIVESFFQGVNNEPSMEKKSATFSAVNLENIEDFVEKFSKFSHILIKKLEDENTRSEMINVLKSSLKETQRYSASDDLKLYTHIDLFDFLEKMNKYSTDEELKKEINLLKEKDIILKSDYKNQEVKDSHGIAILFIENFDILSSSYSPSDVEEMSRQVKEYYAKSNFAKITGWDKVMSLYQQYPKT